jgi:hypothetical protein
MDPDAALAQLRAAVIAWIKAQESGADEAGTEAASDAIHAIVALDAWLSTGGFLPTAWRAKRNGISARHET